jgi:NADH-quinone oxidoreductase subunit L
MPVTFLTFAIGYLAIIGIPPFAGFWSKDKIIEMAFSDNLVFGLAALLGAGVTAFYMTRVMLMTYFGKKRWEESVHPHESPRVMTVPLIALAALSALGGLLLFNDWIVDWLTPVVGVAAEHELGVPVWVLTLIVLAVVAFGILIAWLEIGIKDVPRVAPRKVSWVTRAARADLYGDALNEELLMRPGNRFVDGLVTFDDTIVDGTVNGTGSASLGMSGTFRRIQTGYVRSYALSVMAGAIVVVLALLAVNFA